MRRRREKRLEARNKKQISFSDVPDTQEMPLRSFARRRFFMGRGKIFKEGGLRAFCGKILPAA